VACNFPDGVKLEIGVDLRRLQQAVIAAAVSHDEVDWLGRLDALFPDLEELGKEYPYE
jgi:hypothetical protein